MFRYGRRNSVPDDQVQTMVIAGHQRSGTTLMVRLLNSHPDVFVTHEFYNFSAVGIPFNEHMREVRTAWRDRPIVKVPNRFKRMGDYANSAMFVHQYRRYLKSIARDAVDADAMRTCLHRIAPWARVVGDKVAGYVMNLDKLVQCPDTKLIVIYRDCRDVVRSSLEKAHSSWQGKELGDRLATPENAAQSWVQAIETMQHHREHVYPLRYEQLVNEPRRTLEDLGALLDLDPDKFRMTMIRSDRVGKHKRGLSADQIDQVIQVAKPTMQQLGYL